MRVIVTGRTDSRERRAVALGWPLVWDQDQETAIRSLDLAPSGDRDAEVDRPVAMIDPDGNEFCVLAPRR